MQPERESRGVSMIKHIITGGELSKEEILDLLVLASDIKNKGNGCKRSLLGKQIALSFDKPSFRTRFSFTAAINKLGADAIETVSLTRKSEEPKDFMRVIQGYCDALMIRTFDTGDLYKMKEYATIPIINGLTNEFHPCQTLADLMTLKERFNSFEGLKIAYVGDGNNILHSLLVMASIVGMTVHYCCPPGHQPLEFVLDLLPHNNQSISFASPKDAVVG